MHTYIPKHFLISHPLALLSRLDFLENDGARDTDGGIVRKIPLRSFDGPTSLENRAWKKNIKDTRSTVLRYSNSYQL